MMTESRLAVEIFSNHGMIWTTNKDDLKMSICQKGLDAKVKSQAFSIKISSKDPYIRLANAIDWVFLAELTLPDLVNTQKGYFWLGRKINLRIHLAILILQPLLKETDRGIVDLIEQCPRYQAFCGRGIITQWKCPHHTKIEEFRNRFSVETHRNIGNYVLTLAQELGFADPSWMDIDSTIQEANMAYPSDGSLMRKLSQKCKKVLDYLVFTGKKYVPENISIDIKAIAKKSKEYFFLPKNKSFEVKREVFASYYKLVKDQLKDFIQFSNTLTGYQVRHLPWNIKADLKQIKEKSWRYLLDVAHFARTNSMKVGKILSWHCQEVVCIPKKKAGKENEFGRQVQLGRIGGNFMVAFSSTQIRMEDKKSLNTIIEEHGEIFGPDTLKSIGADKGYYSGKNIAFIEDMKVNADGLQRPWNVKNFVKEEVAQPLRDRRAGIEPLIGHVKRFGLEKSKMKSDKATLASVHRCAMGFNLHQLRKKMEIERKMRLAS